MITNPHILIGHCLSVTLLSGLRSGQVWCHSIARGLGRKKNQTLSPTTATARSYGLSKFPLGHSREWPEKPQGCPKSCRKLYLPPVNRPRGVQKCKNFRGRHRSKWSKRGRTCPKMGILVFFCKWDVRYMVLRYGENDSDQI